MVIKPIVHASYFTGTMQDRRINLDDVIAGWIESFLKSVLPECVLPAKGS